MDQNRERKEWVGGKLAESPLPCDHKIQIKNGACAHVINGGMVSMTTVVQVNTRLHESE